MFDAFLTFGEKVLCFPVKALPPPSTSLIPPLEPALVSGGYALTVAAIHVDVGTLEQVLDHVGVVQRDRDVQRRELVGPRQGVHVVLQRHAIAYFLGRAWTGRDACVCVCVCVCVGVGGWVCVCVCAWE